MDERIIYGGRLVRIPPPYTAREILEEALTNLQPIKINDDAVPRWTRNRWHDEILVPTGTTGHTINYAEVKTVCSMGAMVLARSVQYGMKAGHVNPNGPAALTLVQQDPAFLHATRLLVEAIYDKEFNRYKVRRCPIQELIGLVTDWNDNPHRTLSQVYLAFEKAIKLAIEEEKG